MRTPKSGPVGRVAVRQTGGGPRCGPSFSEHEIEKLSNHGGVNRHRRRPFRYSYPEARAALPLRTTQDCRVSPRASPPQRGACPAPSTPSAAGLLAEAPKAKGAKLGFRLRRNPFLATVDLCQTNDDIAVAVARTTQRPSGGQSTRARPDPPSRRCPVHVARFAPKAGAFVRPLSRKLDRRQAPSPRASSATPLWSCGVRRRWALRPGEASRADDHAAVKIALRVVR